MPPCSIHPSQPAPAPARTFRSPSATRTLLAAVALLGGLFASGPAFGQSVATTPVGAITTTLNAGPATTAVALPFHPDAIYSGPITTVGANTISSAGLELESGALANNVLFYVRILSGEQEGRALPIVGNTGNSIILDISESSNPVELNIANSAIAPGDRFEIFAADTLESMFGSGEDLILDAGTSVFNSDTVGIWNGVKFDIYYYNQTAGFWTKQGQIANANNTTLKPYEGVLIRRRSGASAKNIVLRGIVPTKRALIRHPANNSSKLIYIPFPVDTSLEFFRFSDFNPLTSNTNIFNSDTVGIWNGVKWVAHFRNSANGYWQKLGDPSDFSTTPVSSTTPVLLLRRNTKTGMDNYIGALPPYDVSDYN